VANSLLGGLNLQAGNKGRLDVLLEEHELVQNLLAWHNRLAASESSLETFPRSQLGQDLFALSACEFRHGGFFVEVGAAGGVDLSNTYLLERSFGWSGILAEPARCWHDSLTAARTAIIDQRCVWATSGEELEFAETAEAEYSTVAIYASEDHHRDRRQNPRVYPVATVTLADLLREHNAPSRIDYLSVDTEGSEYEILREVPFNRWSFGAITVEHNCQEPRRSQISDLLARNGYRRVFETATQYDDWYVLAT
jgi:FkbM family methyltransferase